MKDEGYTYIEIIIAIGILSILLWNIIPRMTLIEKRSSAKLSSVIEKTTVTKLVRALTSDFSEIRWPYWQPRPEIRNDSKGMEIVWNDETGEQQSYSITHDNSTIVITRDGRKRLYKLPTLSGFTLIQTGSEIELQLTTGSQSITLPLQYGSKAVAIYE